MKSALIISLIITFSSTGMAASLEDKLNCSSAVQIKTWVDNLSSYDVGSIEGNVDGLSWVEISLPEMPTEAQQRTLVDIPTDVQDSYRFYKLKVGDQHSINYATSRDENSNSYWLSKAWNPALQLLKFNSRWYMMANPDTSPAVNIFNSNGRTFSPDNRVEYSFFPSQAVFVKSQADGYLSNVAGPIKSACYEKSQPVSRCWKEFVIKAPIGSQLTSISDIESVTGHTTSNNTVVYDIQLWGLKAPTIPKKCF